MNYLTPIPKQFSDQSGTPYSYGKVYVYVAGTSELANIYKEADSDVLAENPYTLDVAGSWQCFVPVSTPLDYIVTDTDNNTVFSFKNVSVPSDEGSGASVSKAYVDTQDRALGARISNLAADVDDEVARAEAAEKAAKTEVVEGENIRVEETIAPDGHSIFSVSSDGAPQEQSNWTQQDPSEPDYIKNKPTKLSEFTDDITKQSLVESGVGIEKPVSSAAVNAGLSEKADKVQGATSGNLAALDANGNLTDSGKNAADFKTKQSAVTDPTADGTGLSFIDSVTQNANGEITPHKKTVQDGTTEQKGVLQLEDSFASTSTDTAATPNAVKAAYDLAATAVQGVKVNGTELSKDSNNVVDVPVPTASTATPLKDGTASAGSSTQWARGDHRHPTDDSREAVANKSQTLDPTSTTEYPSSAAVGNFVNSSVATNTATFLGNFQLTDLGLTYPATEVQIAAALNSHVWPTDFPTNNDYVYVEIKNPQTSIDDKVQRYKYRDSLESWGYEYTLNNSSFTAEEKAAIDSGIDSFKVAAYDDAVTRLNNHVNDINNPHNVTKSQVGLGNVDNTSDADKPISTAQQTALNAKQNIISDLATIRSGASAGASALQPDGNGSNLSVTPDGTSMGYDLGSSTTLKVWAQKFKNLVGALKALAFKDKVSTSDIADDAITADKVKDNETLPVNISGSSLSVRPFIIEKSGPTTNVWAKVATASVSIWSGYAITLQIGFSGYTNGNSYAAEISVGYQTRNGGAYVAHQLYIYRRNYSGITAIDAKLVRIDNTLELWVKNGITSTNSYLAPIYMKGFSVNYADSNNMSKQLTDSAFTTYTADKTKYDAIVRTTAFIPGFSPVGSTSTPVYVDSDGEIVPCDPSQMSVGSAMTATNYASGGGIADALAGKSSTSHTHSVKINGATKTIPATGGTAVDLGTYLTQHQDISGKLDKTGDASNTTSTFTKASGDTSSITSGGKLSAIFTAISSYFASLKALAFKDKVSDSDISGTISDSHVASASTWNGKQNALPTTGTASTTYAIGISGNASTASTADKVKNGSNRTKTDNAAPQGLRVDRAYNNGWPYTYGNVITVGGAGDGQLMLGWSNTTGGVAPIYYRNRRDQGGTTWSPWRTIAYQEDNGVSLSGQTLSVKINGTTQSLTNTDNTVKATAKTDNVNYKILATASASPTSGGLTEAVYDTDITLNPSTNTIAANISGRAALATTASQVSATGSQKALAVSVDGISHMNGSKSTVIDGGGVSTDTLSAETAVNSDGFWAKTTVLVYGGDTPDSPTGNYILMSPNGIACYGVASFTGSLVGNASTATAVKDYGNTSKSIEIGYAGDSLTSANFLAAYAVVNGHTYIKDISPSNVTVGRATSDGSGNNIVNTYQKKVMISACARGYSPTINSGSTASVGNRPNNQLGIALLYPLSGSSYIEVSFNLSFTYPSAGGYGAYAVILKAGNSSSSMDQIGSVIKSTYQSGSSNYAEHVTVGGSVSSSPSYLVLEITNGYGSSVTFNLSTILIRITQNVTAAAQAT